MTLMAISQVVAATGHRNVDAQDYSLTKTNVFVKMKYQVNIRLHLMLARSQPMTEFSTVESMNVFKIVTPQNLSHLSILQPHQNQANSFTSLGLQQYLGS